MSEKLRKKLDNRKSQNFKVSRKIAALLQAQQRVQKIRNNPYESLEDEQDDRHLMDVANK